MRVESVAKSIRAERPVNAARQYRKQLKELMIALSGAAAAFGQNCAAEHEPPQPAEAASIRADDGHGFDTAKPYRKVR